MKQSEPGIDERNALWKRRDALMAAYQQLHGVDLASDTLRVAKMFANEIVDAYWKRDADGGPRDAALIESAISARDALRAGFELEAQLQGEAARLRAEARAAARANALDSATGLQWKEHIEVASKRAQQQRRECMRLCDEFERAAEAARCRPEVFDDMLEVELAKVPGGERIEPVERWDRAFEIWRRFGGTITPKGISDERVRLHKLDDAIALTLYIRAVISEDPAEDFLMRELIALEDDRLRDRRAEPGLYRGLATHQLVARHVWPSLEGGRGTDDPISKEEAERRTILDGDARLERYVAAGEKAYAAVTRMDVPNGSWSGEQDGPGKPSLARRGKSRGKPGRKIKYPVEDDLVHLHEMERLGIGPKKYADGTGEDYAKMKLLKARGRYWERKKTAK